MTKDNENEPQGGSEDRIEDIKKEAAEDASSYYTQEEEVKEDMKSEFEKPVENPEKGKEDLSFLKALAFLGFGFSMLAVILIFFFIKDLDDRVGGMGSTVTELEGTIKPLKSDVESSLSSMQSAIDAIQGNIGNINQDVSSLKGQFGDYERNQAIMELKRALVMVQEVTATGPASMKSKSAEVISSIESLLSELGAGSGPAGTITVKEAPAVEEAPVEEAPVEEEAPAEEAPVEEEAPAEEADEEESDSGEAEASDDEAGEEDGEAEEDDSDEEAAAPAEAGHGEEAEAHADAGHGEEATDAHAAEASHSGNSDELPTVEELLSEES